MYIPKHFEITGIQCKYKLSQNRSAEDQSQITKQLQEKGSGELALAMNTNER
jgi:transcriptional regulator